MFFYLEITTSPGNGLCNVACSEVNLRKTRSLPLQHLHTIALFQALLIRNRALGQKVKFIKNFGIVSRAALKGSEGREFDTPALQHCNKIPGLRKNQHKIKTTTICETEYRERTIAVFVAMPETRPIAQPNWELNATNIQGVPK